MMHPVDECPYSGREEHICGYTVRWILAHLLLFSLFPGCDSYPVEFYRGQLAENKRYLDANVGV